MGRKVLFIAVGIAGCAAAVAGAIELRTQEDARKLAFEAEQVMQAPLARAPELSKIDVQRALLLLERSQAIRDAERTKAVLAWAQALDEYQKGRPTPARRALQRAQRTLSGSADLEVLAAAIAMQDGHAEQASAHAAKALALQPKHARARVLAADLAADAGQAARALALLQQLIADEPDIGALYNRRGLCEEALGDTETALADFERAATLDPSLPQPHINIGRLLRDRGRARDAERAFALALERAASEPEAWLGRGLSRVALGDLEGGRLDIQQARELGPAEPAPLVALADLDAWHGQLDRAVERYRAALTLADSDAVAWLKLGNALVRKREYAQARTSFERAIALQPSLAAAHNGLGAALLGQRDPLAAKEAFATAAALDDRDPNPVRNLALLAKRQGTHHNARTIAAPRPAPERSARLD